MKQKVNVSGSTVIDSDLDLEDRVVIVIIGQVSKEGQTLQATAGRVDFRTVKMNDAIVLAGAEAAEMQARVTAENQETDLAVINGGGG